MNDMIKIEKDMTPKLIGETYMKYPAETSQQRYSFGVYECQYCGKEFEAKVSNIKNKNTKSCGCQIINNFGTTHGLKSNRFYQTWYNMVKRCNNPKSAIYKYYGARGITVCEEWLDVTNFVAWAEATHPNVKGVSLDRIDNDKGYSPENCTWSDKTTQCVNQRIRKDNTSGFVGVDFRPSENKYIARITVLGDRVYIGYFDSIEEAVQARDTYIIDNGLPHKLSTDYMKENK